MNRSGIKRKNSTTSLPIESDMIMKKNNNKQIILSSYEVPFYTEIKNNIDRQKYRNEELIGYFDRLPEEIIIKIFQLLSIEELGQLTMTNSKIRDFIIKYFFFTQSGFVFLIRTNQFDSFDVYEPKFVFETQQLFVRIGLLIKRSTLLFPTNDRIDIIIHIMKSGFGIPSIRLLSNQDYVHFKLIIKCYSKLINSFIQGWRDFECSKMFQKLKGIFSINSFSFNLIGEFYFLNISFQMFVKLIYKSKKSLKIP